jgi:recombination protein RecT
MSTALTPTQPENGQRPAAARPVDTLRGLLDRSKGQIAAALPKHLTAERMVRVALTAFQRTPALQECSPLSVVAAVVQAAELGLELSGPLGQAYLVPYWNKNTGQKEAQFQVGYRGLIDLAYRSGRVANITAHVVYRNDRFRFAYGTRPFIEHLPTLEATGEPVAVYAVTHFKGGAIDFEVMSVAQVEAHRQRYSKQRSKDSPWETAWQEMAKKTVLRRLAKRAPVSVEMQRAAAADEQAEFGVAQPASVELAPTEPWLIEGAATRSEQVLARLEGVAADAPEREPGADDGP